jgi:hypothetical protein
MEEEVERKRDRNEKKFSYWEELEGGGRKYWYEVIGKFGFRARYIKEVDEREETIKFYQEIYNNKGILEEIHEKFPTDLGHRRIKNKRR